MRSTQPSEASAAVGGFLSGLGKVFVVVLALVAVVAALVAAVPSQYRITRTITIDAPPSQVFAHVNDFRKWNAWSPWEKIDPAAKYTFEGPASGTGAHLQVVRR